VGVVAYEDDQATVWHGDCLDNLREMPDSSVDAIVTDPPYGLGFMGKAWDDLPPGLPWAQECLRVLKPGGHLLAFGGTRTWHRLAVAVEDAGFEVRDSIAWLYGSGFPKSMDVSKAIDKAGHLSAQWAGWGTALKPAFEPIVVARKPLVGTVAANVLAHGTGALNIDGTRVPHGEDVDLEARQRQQVGEDNGWRLAKTMTGTDIPTYKPGGRWPANVLLDGDAAAELDAQSGDRPGMRSQNLHTTKPKFEGGVNLSGSMTQQTGRVEGYNDQGGASRFFPTFRYQAKAPTRERPSYITDDGSKVAHPTVKPLALMRWLVRLVTPPGGLVLDPFAGSGTTVEAAILEGFRVIGIEREADYLPLIEARIARNRITAEGLPAVADALALFDFEEPA